MTAYDDLVLAGSPDLYYKLDDASGNFINYGTWGSGGNLTTESGTITRSQAAIAPGLGNSVKISGANTARISVNVSGFIPTTGTGQACSVEGWILQESNATANGGYNSFFCLRTGSANEREILMIIGSGTPATFYCDTAANSSNHISNTAAVITPFKPYYVCMQLTPDDRKLIYVNARLYSVSYVPSNRRYSAQSPFIYFGAAFDSTWGSMTGTYSNFAFYSYNLSEHQMEQRMAHAYPDKVAHRGGLG